MAVVRQDKGADGEPRFWLDDKPVMGVFSAEELHAAYAEDDPIWAFIEHGQIRPDSLAAEAFLQRIIAGGE